MRSNNAFLTTSLFLSLTAGCGLIKVNGKPLGGGSSPSASSSGDGQTASSSSSSSPGSSEEDCSALFGAEYRACEQRVTDRRNESIERPLAAARGKRPAFCAEYHFSETQDIDLAQFKDFFDPKDDRTLVAAKMFGEAMCGIRGKLDDRPKLMEMRAQWMKLKGLDELDFVTAIGLQSHNTWGSQDWETLGPAVAQMKYAKAVDLDRSGAKASMLASFAWVRTCMGGQREGNDGHPLEKVLCVLEPLDVAKADAEIEAAPKINQESRFNLRQFVRQTAKEQARFKTALAALQKEEPAIGKLLAIGEKERAEWTKPSAARAKLIAQVETMEQATASKKRSAFTGCDAPTHASWSEVVRSRDLPNVNTKDLLDSMRRAVFTTSEAYLAYRAMELCLAGLSPDGRFDSKVASRVIRRGWRTSTVAAWFAASGDIKFDSRDLSVAMVVGRDAVESTNMLGDADSGTIAKLTNKGAKTLVEFKQVSDTYEDCIAWVPTRQIDKVDSSGNVYYVNKCTKTGMVTYDRTPKDIEVETIFAEGLKPGMRLYTYGFAIAATANAKSSKPVWLFGVSLK